MLPGTWWDLADLAAKIGAFLIGVGAVLTGAAALITAITALLHQLPV
jgi:hypothetical protein